MDENKLKEQLEDLYEENKLKKVFKILKQNLDKESDRRKIFIILKQRYKKLQDDKMTETITRSDANIEANLIGKSLLEFINSLEPNDLSSKNIQEDKEITNPIIVFTSKDEVKNLTDFFQQLNYSNLYVIPFNEIENCQGHFDLAIFDNTDLKSCPKKFLLEKLDVAEQNKINIRIEKMELILKEKSKYMIHFGEFLYWINENRNRAQGANSKFSLHARTKEVIDFINTYRGE